MLQVPFDSRKLASILVHDIFGQLIIRAFSISEYRTWCQQLGWPRTGTIVMSYNDGQVVGMSVEEFHTSLEEEGIAEAETAAMLQGCEGPDALELEALSQMDTSWDDDYVRPGGYRDCPVL